MRYAGSAGYFGSMETKGVLTIQMPKNRYKLPTRMDYAANSTICLGGTTVRGGKVQVIRLDHRPRKRARKAPVQEVKIANGSYIAFPHLVDKIERVGYRPTSINDNGLYWIAEAGGISGSSVKAPLDPRANVDLRMVSAKPGSTFDIKVRVNTPKGPGYHRLRVTIADAARE